MSTTDSYTYLSTVTETLNEGLPRAAWSTIGNVMFPMSSRITLTYTLILFQSLAGLVLSLVFLAAAPRFAAAFIPVARATSITYVRLSAFSALASTVENAVALSTRALDKPDVPLLISSVKITLNIILDFIFISTFHVRGVKPTVLSQAAIRLTCDLIGAAAGLVYFIILSRRRIQELDHDTTHRGPLFSIRSLKTLAHPGAWTFTESAVRNAIYLYLVHGIVFSTLFDQSLGTLLIFSLWCRLAWVTIMQQLGVCLILSDGG